MTKVSPKKNHDPARVNEISAKLMENPELASLISELSASTDDASDLVKGLLQASINAGLQAEMDAHWAMSILIGKAKPRWTLPVGRTTVMGRIPKLLVLLMARWK